jgi:hypothetical protein
VIVPVEPMSPFAPDRPYKVHPRNRASGALRVDEVAEAFARAVPDSTYAPQLLDTAATLIESSDKTKAAGLRELLRSRYPEDPAAQDRR